MQDVESAELRQCKTCLQDKPLDDFYKSKGSWGTSRQCKKCTCARTNAHAAANRERYNEYHRGFHKRSPDSTASALRKWREKNKDAYNAYQRNRRRENPNARVAERYRGRLRELVRSNRKRSLDILGCTPDELRAHLESLWLPGMSWDNYGLFGWHIDHKLPCCSFDLTDPDQQRQCFHYTNLQPLWAEDNLRKGGLVLSQTSKK